MMLSFISCTNLAGGFKPKYIELWSCPECIQKQKEEDKAKELGANLI